jgi:hypothetical protein
VIAAAAQFRIPFTTKGGGIMASRTWGVGGLAGVLLLAGTLTAGDTRSAETKKALHLEAGQKDFLWLEPVLVTVRLEGARGVNLPAVPATGKSGILRFEVEPGVKPRKGARPLPLEALADAATRHYDLSEWFAFPDKGTWTVRAVLEQPGASLTSKPIRITIARPAKGDAEEGPVARIHHTPWSNYDTNAFCGDTFDLVQKWPTSRLARYCHYWNGRFNQNKKEFDKALASYRVVLEKYPDFVLADAAEYGIIQCLCAQGKLAEARERNAALRKKLDERATRSRSTAVQRLADEMSQRLDREVGKK